MLTPGTYAWPDAVPAVLVAVAVLVVPGAVAARLVGVRAGLALAVGPALSTVVVVVGGSVAGAVGVAWGAVPLVVTVLLAWCLAAAVGALARRISPHSPGSATATAPDGPRSAQVLGVCVGLVAAAVVVGYVLVRASSTPEEFPEHPDTIFHLGVTQWMATSADVSFQHGTRFTGAVTNVGYPVAFHSVAATVALLSGVPAVVAVSALVLVAAALVWPLGMALLARAVLGSTPAVGLVAPVAAVLFVAYPYTLMGFGVLWPNMFGQALLPSVLAAAVLLTARPAPLPSPAPPLLPVALVVPVAVAGLGLAHPNAVVTAVVFVALATLIAALRHAFVRGRGTARSWGAFVTASAAVLVGSFAWVVLAPPSMRNTGAPGPEMTMRQAVVDVVGTAPRGATPVLVLGAVVLAGAVLVLLRRPSAVWVVVAAGVMSALYVLNTAVDSPAARLLTWPWYNNAIRLAAVGVVPLSLLVTAAVVLPAGWVAARRRGRGSGAGAPAVSRHGWVAEPVVAGVLLALLVVPLRANAPRDLETLRPYFHPTAPDLSWASPAELESLRRLAAHVPPDGLVVADPWRGGSYMYVVSGRRMYYPSEKLNTTPDRRLVGLRLDAVATDPEVCRVVTDAGITHALVGGDPFRWSRGRSEAEFPGVEAVADSPAFEEVATAEPFTLYRFTSCRT